MGDYQARFCERLRVKLPLPTRHKPSDCLITILHAEIIRVADFKKNEILKSQRLNFTF